jgi:NADH-quinone oxidoreductase subunit G
MCDDGMLTYERIYTGRVLKSEVDGEETTTAKALARAGELVSKHKGSLAVVLSAQRSVEENLAAVELAKAAGADLYLTGKGKWDGDAILRNEDQNPNRAGAVKISGKESLPGVDALVKKASSYTCVLVLGEDADVSEDTVNKLDGKDIVLLATHDQGGAWLDVATVVIPVAVWAETDGTFVNAKGLAQAFKRALAPRGDVVPAWEALTKVSKSAGLDTGFARFSELRAAAVSRGVEVTVPKKQDGVLASTGTPRSTV